MGFPGTTRTVPKRGTRPPYRLRQIQGIARKNGQSHQGSPFPGGFQVAAGFFSALCGSDVAIDLDGVFRFCQQADHLRVVFQTLNRMSEQLVQPAWVLEFGCR